MTSSSQLTLYNEPYLGWRSTSIVVCATIASSYLVPTLVGLLASNPQTVWPLWPGCAILVTGLLLVRLSVWPLLIVTSFIGFALADLESGVSLSSIAWFVPGNTVEVLISAISLRYCFGGVPRLNSIKALAKYSFFAVVLAPSAGACLSGRGVARDYWMGWKIVFLSEVLAFITLAPVLLSWVSEGRVFMRRSRAHHLEGVMLIAGLVTVSSIVFTVPADSRSPALFYALVPFLLWSALRFGWLGVSTSLVAVTSLSIWGAVYGRGPFSHLVPLTDPLPLQMFLVFASVPFMALAALAEEHQEAAHVVRESEERFRLVANTAPALIWMSGTDKLWTYFNKPWLDFTGRSIEQELGNGWTESVHPDDLQTCTGKYLESFDKRERFSMEYRLRRHDGLYRWIIDIGIPRFDPDRSFAGYIGIAIDVSDRKAAEEASRTSEERLRLAQQTARMGAFEWNIETGINTWSPELEALYGLPPGGFGGTQTAFENLIHPEDRGQVIASCSRSLKTGQPSKGEWRVIWPDGSVHWLLSRWQVFMNESGQASRMIGVNVDITERKLAEQTVAEMTRKLLEAQEQERSRIGRELHDDISQRIAMLSIELEQILDDPSELTIRVQDLRQRMMELSNDVQALSHELHSSKLEYLGPVGAIRSWCDEFGKRQKMEVDFSSDLSSDLPFEVGVCLFRVLQEALHNALKHSGVKQIEVQLAEHSGEVHLTVRDFGRGFDVDSAKREKGLGLTSMSERVRLVDGMFTINSNAMKGTTIHIKVPLISQNVSRRAAV